MNTEEKMAWFWVALIALGVMFSVPEAQAL